MNCVACGVRKSTRSDLLCDECRELKTSSRATNAANRGRDITNPYDDPGWKAYAEHARNDLFPELKASAMTMHIVAEDPDPKVCLELGASILFDKPIVLLVPKGRKIPLNLRSIAVEIVEVDLTDSGESQERVNAAMQRVLAMLDFRGSVKP